MLVTVSIDKFFYFSDVDKLVGCR